MAINPLSRLTQRLRHAALLGDGAGLTDGQLLEFFITQKDEGAFAAIVQRHGPMVLGVCRRLLHNHHDAEDAFQAAFLVLARKAMSVCPREMVANFLHGVAYHTALKARAKIAKRRLREKQLADLPEPQGPWPGADNCYDLRPLLDQELKRLPDKYRLPIILCDLEGRSIKEATRQLGCPQGTLAGRLARARKMLAKRLSQRGTMLSLGALAVLCSENPAAANLPPALIGATVKAASMMSAGPAAVTGLVSAKVLALTAGVLQGLILGKIQVVGVALLLLTLIGGGAGLVVAYHGQAEKTATGKEVQRPVANKNQDRRQADPEMLKGAWALVAVPSDRPAALDEPAKEERDIECRMLFVVVGDTVISRVGSLERTLSCKRGEIRSFQGTDSGRSIWLFKLDMQVPKPAPGSVVGGCKLQSRLWIPS